MAVIVKCNHPIWCDIWYNLRDRYLNCSMTRRELEIILYEKENIHIIKDGDNRWEEICLPDGSDLVMLIMQYGR